MKQGWKSVTLGELTSNRPICYGVLKPGERQSIGVPLIRITDIKNNYLDKTNIYHITQSLSDEFKRSILKGGEILLSIQGTVGRVAICPDDLKGGNISRTIAIISPDDSVNKYFLRYWLLSMDGKFPITGATRASLNIGAIRELVAPIPPLDEQKRIVAKLDECFEAIDKARANVEQNLNNAKELFQSRKNDLFKKLEEDLSKVPLPSVCDEIFAGGDAPKDNYSKEKTETFNIPIIANAVKDNGLYGYTNKIRVSKPSITIAARGSGTGHTEIRYEPFFPIVRLIVIIPNDGKVKLEFLKYSIQNFDIMRSGSAIPQLTVPMIKDYSLLLPSIPEQKQIVNQLDKLKSQTQSLESNYQQELDALDELKKSILQKAFNGEL